MVNKRNPPTCALKTHMLEVSCYVTRDDNDCGEGTGELLRVVYFFCTAVPLGVGGL